MKTVWVLENWKTPERMQETINDFEEMLEQGKEDADFVAKTTHVIEVLKQELIDNPEGIWTGFVGRTNYKQFCWDAQDDLRFWRKKDKTMKFRVVKAEIQDNANTWLGYVNPVENSGVLRYLYATLGR